MRQRHLSPLLAALAIVGLLVAARPASAGHVGFSIGATFPVGPGMVSLMIGQPTYGYGYGYGYENRYPAYGRAWEAQPFYFRVAVPLHHHGVHCSDRCYTRGGYTYHHPSCPALHAYFDAYDVYPGSYWPYQDWSPDWTSYGYQAPGYRTYRAPAYRAPVYRAPIYRAPAYRPPVYRVPRSYSHGDRSYGRRDTRHRSYDRGRYDDGRGAQRDEGRSRDSRWRERGDGRGGRDPHRDRDWRDHD